MFGPFEYPGLAYYCSSTREFLLASFTGTDPNDVDPDPNDAYEHKSVIWSSLIELDPNDPNDP